MQHAGFGQGHEVIEQIARAIALVRMRRVFPLAAADNVLGAWKARPQAPGRVALREAARMVEVEVRGEHEVDVFGREARLGQRVIEVSGAFDAVDVDELLAFLVAEPRVDNHRARSTDDERSHRQNNSVALVGRRLLLPQGLRHDAEHRASVEAEEAVADRDELEVAQSAAGDAGVCRTIVLRYAVRHYRGLLQLDQNSVGTRGMNERDERAFGAWTRLWVHEPSAVGFQPRKRRVNVLDAQRDVVKAGAALLDESRDRRLRRRRLEQFEARFASRLRVLVPSISSPSASR